MDNGGAQQDPQEPRRSDPEAEKNEGSFLTSVKEFDFAHKDINCLLFE